MSFIFSENWLKEWIAIDDQRSLSDVLTALGLEVESIEPVSKPLSKIVIGEVIGIAPHPNADRLKVCQVNAGAEMLTIVCGAKNVTVGSKYPVALVGAVLPGGHTIKKAKLRGVESQGMLCSGEELCLQESHQLDGLLQLPAQAPVGELLEEYLALKDCLIEIAITPNRADCLSILGVARELSAVTRVPLNNNFYTTPTKKPVRKAQISTPKVQVSTPSQCPRYIGCVIEGINAEVESPIWMKERLRRSGLRPRTLIVDVTQYVMLELGQPMHAFDLDKIEGNITVRYAQSGETLSLINGETVTLDGDTQIISDAKKPLAIAGVMGGESTAVTDTTQHVFLESAFFTPLSIIHSIRHYNITSDSSYRFERGVDPNLQKVALERATDLLITLAGGEAGPMIECTHDAALPQPKPILLRPHYIQRVLGQDCAQATVESVLQGLQMAFKRVEAGWEVIAPSYRFDIAQEIDLVEEILRVEGYETLIKSKPLAVVDTSHALPEYQTKEQRLAEWMSSRGYHQIITYSFVDQAVQDCLEPRVEALSLSNPMSESMNVMRTHLWPGLISTLKYNYHRQQDRIRLFEIGQCFNPDKIKVSSDPVSVSEGKRLPDEAKRSNGLGGIAYGYAMPEQWGLSKRRLDFFDIKGDVESLLSLNRCGQHLHFVVPDVTHRHPALHPGESILIQVKSTGDTVGHIGALHPQVIERLDLPSPIYLFDLDLDAIAQGMPPQSQPLSKYPALRRDIALVVEKKYAYDKIRDCITQEAGDLLKSVRLFDLYEDSIKAGCCSLGLGLIFQNQERTLVEEEINHFIEKLLTKLKKEFNILVRE